MRQGLFQKTLPFSAIICGLVMLIYPMPVFAADASLSWNPNTEPDLAGYKVYYGTASRTYGSPINVGNQTAFAVTGLSAGTYYFAVTAFDTSGNESVFSAEVSKAITTADTTPPVLSSIQSANVTATGATISWSTNEASDTQVEYGTTTAYGNATPLNTSLVTAHSVSLSGLQANTTYNYRVKSRDAAGNLAASGNLTFVTPTAPPPADTTPPVLSSIQSTNITSSGASITWSTDEASDTQVEYGTTTAYGSWSPLNASLVMAHSASLSGLQANTTYNYRVKSRDAAGNLAVSGNRTFATSPPPDTTPPVLSSIQSTNITSSGASITWSTNEASDTQVEYGTTTAYGSWSPLNASLVMAHSASLSGLQASTSYSYRVKSRDAAGNLSVSGTLTFTTPTATSPTCKFTQISFSKVSNTSVRINWSTDKATTGLIQYGTNSVGELSNLETTLATQHRTDLVGLTPSTVYLYRITATDASNNQASTDILKFKTANKPGRSATPSSDATFISQVVETSDFRTNLGVNNLSTSTANVSVTLVDVDGMELATKTLQVEPQGLTQLNAVAPYVYEENLGNEIRGNLYLESDQPISAWASQIENRTNDPSLLLSQRAGATKILIPSAANTAKFTSSLVLMNVGVNPANVAIKAYSVEGAVLGQTATPLSVPANGILSFDNILETLGVKDNYGPLEITSLDAIPLVAASRVSSTSKAGGFFEGISYSDASQVQFIPHVVDTAELRTNIGINNVSDTLASVTVKLMSSQGSELGALSVMVMPRGMTQLNQVVRQLLKRGEVTNVEGYVRLESSQPILGWASQIDNTTDDPGFAVSKGVGASKLLVQSTANIGNFKSSLVVVNLGEAAAAVDIVAYNVQGTVQGELRGQVISPRGFVSFANVLESLGAFNSFGPVKILSTNGQPLLATSRVYSLSRTSGFFEAQALE